MWKILPYMKIEQERGGDLLGLQGWPQRSSSPSRIDGLPDGEPNWRLLEVRQQLGAEPAGAGGLCDWVWEECGRRQGWADLRGDGWQRRWRGDAQKWNATLGGHPDGASLDHLLAWHEDHSHAGAHHEQLQNHRWPWLRCANSRWCRYTYTNSSQIFLYRNSGLILNRVILQLNGTLSRWEFVPYDVLLVVSIQHQ